MAGVRESGPLWQKFGVHFDNSPMGEDSFVDQIRLVEAERKDLDWSKL